MRCLAPGRLLWILWVLHVGLWDLFPARPTDARSHWDMGNLGGLVDTSGSLLCSSAVVLVCRGCIVQRCLGASTQRILSRSGFNVVADWLYMNDEQEAAGQAGSLSGGAQRRQLEDS